jgi:hypothetical protein
MTSEEIKLDRRNVDIAGPSHEGFGACAKWLKEISFQLARMNEWEELRIWKESLEKIKKQDKEGLRND